MPTPPPSPPFQTNIEGTWVVLEACREAGVEVVVVASSDKAYGTHKQLPYTEDSALQPVFPYDVSKAATVANCRTATPARSKGTVSAILASLPPRCRSQPTRAGRRRIALPSTCGSYPIAASSNRIEARDDGQPALSSVV